jgi:hypothetical protein
MKNNLYTSDIFQDVTGYTIRPADLTLQKLPPTSAALNHCQKFWILEAAMVKACIFNARV